MPTDKALSMQFAVSRPTVARTLASLQQADVIERRPGYGIMVVSMPKD